MDFYQYGCFFLFPTVISMQIGPQCRPWDVQSQLQTKLLRGLNGKFCPHTEKSGQDGVRCGLHLKHTAPKKALVVQSEGRRRNIDCFFKLDLKEKRRDRLTSQEQTLKYLTMDVFSFSVNTCL